MNWNFYVDFYCNFVHIFCLLGWKCALPTLTFGTVLSPYGLPIEQYQYMYCAEWMMLTSGHQIRNLLGQIVWTPLKSWAGFPRIPENLWIPPCPIIFKALKVLESRVGAWKSFWVWVTRSLKLLAFSYVVVCWCSYCWNDEHSVSGI